MSPFPGARPAAAFVACVALAVCDPTGIGGTTSQGSDGFIFLGSKTRAYGSNNPSAVDEADGEDRFFVYYLQDTDVTTGPANVSTAGHTLTLDGQAESDVYEIHTLGSQGDERNYVINVLDTGAENDGVDELTIFGLEGDGGATSNDIFLLRAARELPNESADRPAYVAMLHGDVKLYRDLITGNETPANGGSPEVQRINYDTGLNGRLTVLGLGGNDYFGVDDSTVNVTLDGGVGDDTFQVGQLFGLERDTLDGLLLAEDIFPTLTPTTRGWLSPGNSAPMVIQGGTGADVFTVYSNQAELRLQGHDDNDSFEVRAFALAQVSHKFANILPRQRREVPDFTNLRWLCQHLVEVAFPARRVFT